MNQEEQDKIYQLIQTEDINNWELAYQLIRGLLIDRDTSNYWMEKYLNSHLEYVRNNVIDEYSIFEYQNIRRNIQDFVQTMICKKQNP